MVSARGGTRVAAILLGIWMELAGLGLCGQVAATSVGSGEASTLAGQSAPDLAVGPQATRQFEHDDSVLSLPAILLNQFFPLRASSPLTELSASYLRSIDSGSQPLSLKQAIYLALRNNPGVLAARLQPVMADASVMQQAGIFDPDLTGVAQQQKTVIPATTPIETFQGNALETKTYAWNFGVNKILASTNGTLSLTFNNLRTETNNLTQTINPSYTPTLALSLSQPLLRNFGWGFATINVDLAESSQKQAQWSYAQALTDFVQKVGGDYWSVVAAQENLAVAEEGLRFYRDLVHVNSVQHRVGMLAPLDLEEAQASEATARANLYSSRAALKNALNTLREDVMLNPAGTFVPRQITPSDRPNPDAYIDTDERDALVSAVENRASLAQMREAIRAALLQVKYSENQLLPQVNAQSQISINSLAGDAVCGPNFGYSSLDNCIQSPGPINGDKPNMPGVALPFSGNYASALNQMFGFGFYNYVAILSFERPLANATARAALAQTRAAYQQIGLQYQAALSQAVNEVENGLANAQADVDRVQATSEAVQYARHALHNEQVRFRAGMASTHDLLQYQSEYINARGNQVQAEIDLENAKLALWHANGTLLHHFQIAFTLQPVVSRSWYARF
ncbi:MAG TPA: TolC family protein [Candidatus Binataceae bacterium]|nr:TolC family protein [Candidatus Binataceae bacterium]